MILDNLQIIIEVVLVLVIIIGIISSRSIAKRLSVVRETYNALTQMVANLDSSTEHAGRLFEAMQLESSKGGKKLGALVEYARNATEDLQDLQKMAVEVSAGLERDVKNADDTKEALLEVIKQAQRSLETLEGTLASRHLGRKLPQNVFPDSFEPDIEILSEDTLPEPLPETKPASLRVFSPSEKVTDLPPEEEISQVKFSDKIDLPVPKALKEPRPYMSALDGK